MRRPALLAVALGAFAIAPQVHAAATNVYECPGTNGAYARESTLVGGNGFRTGAGFDPFTVLVQFNVDVDNPGQDGVLWATHRESNDALGHALVFDDSGNRLEYQYNAATQFGLSASSVVAGTQYVGALTYAGNGGDVTLRLITLSTATQAATNSGASGGSTFSDSEDQEMMFCGYESGGTVFQEFDGQAGHFLVIRGVELSQAQIEAWTADILNEGDVLVAQNGTSIYWWDDSGEDQGGNAVGELTLATVTFGTGNGPDIPEREVPPPPEGATVITNRRRHE